MIARALIAIFLFTQTAYAMADEDQSLKCTLKAKAVQAGSFWGGTYFSTSVTSEKISALVIQTDIKKLKKGEVKSASTELVVKDQSILVAKKDDEEKQKLSYTLELQNKSRQVSSQDSTREHSVNLKTSIKFNDEVFDKEFNVLSGHKSYIHFQVAEPSLLDFQITNLFMICTIK